MSSRPMGVPPPSIVAAIVVRDTAGVGATFEAVRRQVYEPQSTVLVGGGPEAKNEAVALGVPWFASVPDVVGSVDPSVTHVWLVSSGAEPRPDALRALAAESVRLDAGIAGSKLLDADSPDRLVSIGHATDVYGVPYIGIDPDEIDAGQYDVVRDVAVVELDSMLIRRDLARGVGAVDASLDIESAAMDLCQRARLRGARIVIVPSSEVLVGRLPEAPLWQREAGRIRSMFKAYSPLTLAWAIPVRFLLGLVESLGTLFVGRFTLVAWLRAWLWNLLRFPSTMRLRRAARRGETLGDAELFRYQVRGSVALRALAGEIGERLRRRLPGEDRFDLAAVGRELRQPAFVVGGLAVVFSLLATRSLWGSGLPAVGFSLPLPEDATAELGAYAGGWNPGGFGSTEPLPPLVGLAGVVQYVLFGSPEVAAAVMFLAAMLLGIWGTTRLLGGVGVGPVAGLVAGIALVAGPGARTITGQTGIGTALALGIVPWAIGLALARWPARWLQRAGRVFAVALATAVAAVAAPPMLAVPTAVVAVWALLNPRDTAAWTGLAVAASGAVLAVPAMLPWVAAADVAGFLDAGAFYWEPGVVLAGLVAVALAAGLLVAPARTAAVVAWGGVVAAGGLFVARASDLGVGREVALAGIAAASLGSAFVVGAVLDTLRQVDAVTGWRRVLSGVGVAAAIGVAASAALVVLPGRAGLPRDAYTEPLRFAQAIDDSATGRILLVGPPNELPGEYRTVRGAAYRVISSPMPDFTEVWLAEPGPADEALEATLSQIIDGETFRAGEDLAPFGIRWILVAGDTPLFDVFEGQLDLALLDGLRLPTFANDAPVIGRAVTGGGEVWARTAQGYEGTPEAGGRVFLAETPDSRWGPDPWARAEWGNEVAADQGLATFEPIPQRRTQGIVALGWIVVIVGGAFVGRRR